MRLILLCLINSALCAPDATWVIRAVAQAAITLPAPAVTRPIQPPSDWWYIRTIVTGYSPYDIGDRGRADTEDTKTATMTDWRSHPYGIAVDPRIIPYGTYIQVPGYLERAEPDSAWKVDDTGGKMRQSWRRGVLHIDVRFKTEASARQFGKKTLDVLIDTSTMTDVERKRLLPYKTGEL